MAREYKFNNLSELEEKAIKENFKERDSDFETYLKEQMVHLLKVLSAIFNKYGEIKMTVEELENATVDFGIMASEHDNGVIVLKKIDNPYTVVDTDLN